MRSHASASPRSESISSRSPACASAPARKRNSRSDSSRSFSRCAFSSARAADDSFSRARLSSSSASKALTCAVPAASAAAGFLAAAIAIPLSSDGKPLVLSGSWVERSTAASFARAARRRAIATRLAVTPGSASMGSPLTTPPAPMRASRGLSCASASLVLALRRHTPRRPPSRGKPPAASEASTTIRPLACGPRATARTEPRNSPEMVPFRLPSAEPTLPPSSFENILKTGCAGQLASRPVRRSPSQFAPSVAEIPRGSSGSSPGRKALSLDAADSIASVRHARPFPAC